MSKMAKITIDGTEFQAPEGMNLIDAAELAGIHIPNLCYLKGMKGVGACRLCLVEIEGGRGMAIACNSKVKDGMVVKTKTDEILESRKFVIDLILSMHPLDCMTCTKAGICNLQRYAYDFNLQESSFKRKKFGHPVDMGNPFIKMSPDYCVLCGRCVRVCKEQGTNVLEFMGRGVGAKVTTVVDRTLHESDCTFCGSCIDACPVNAIIEHDRTRKGREWEFEKTKSVCMLCGNACDIKVKSKGNDVMRIQTGAEKGSAMKYICAYGRFSYDYLDSEERLLNPMVRNKKGELVETTWKEAIKAVAEGLKKHAKSTGIVSVASITNEDALAIKQFGEKVIKTKNIDTTMSLYADPESLKNSETALIGDADLIMLVGIDPSQRERVLPALNVSIRRSVERGAKLIIINSSETKLDKITDLGIHGVETESLKAFIKAVADKGAETPKKLKDAVKDAKVTEVIERAAEVFVNAKKPIIFASPAIFDATQNISLIKGKTLAVSYESNSKGVAHVGLTTKGKTYKEMIAGATDALYVIGEIPLNQRPDTKFLVVQNTHINELCKQADVLLPAASYLASPGTIIDYKGRLKHVARIIEPKGNSKVHQEILRLVAAEMDAKMTKIKESDVKKLVKVEPKIKQMPFEKREDLDVKPSGIMDSLSTSLLSSSRLYWLKETERTTAKK